MRTELACRYTSGKKTTTVYVTRWAMALGMVAVMKGRRQRSARTQQIYNDRPVRRQRHQFRRR